MTNWFDGQESPHSSGLNANCPPIEQLTNTDGQVRVVGRIHNSGNQPYPGWLRITAQETIGHYGRSPRTVVSRRSHQYTIPSSGLIDIVLVNSIDSGSSYLFELGYTETVIVDTVPTQQDKVTDSWYARVPRPSEPGGTVELANLLPTPISTDRLDTSVYRIAEAIVTDDVLRQRALTSFNTRGLYNQNTVYTYGDVVTVSGSPFQTWVCTVRGKSIPGSLFPNPDQFLRLL